MPGTRGQRKQRFVLDIDDIVRRGFMSKENAEALFEGINESGSVIFLGVMAGGTGNNTFTDQEVLKFDAATGKIISAGFTGVLPGGNSIFIPRETGTLYSTDGVDRTLNDSSEMAIASQSFLLPANSQWSDILVVFQFVLTDTQPTVSGLNLRLVSGDGNLEPTQPSSILSPLSTTLYQAGSTPDTQTVTWICMGQIPEDHAFDSVLQFSLLGIPNDFAPYRSVISRVSYRGLQPEPAAGGNKGVPVFLNTPVQVYSGLGVNAWTSFDVSSLVPAGASAIILSSYGQLNNPNNANLIKVRIRPSSIQSERILTGYRSSGDGDETGNGAQGIFPFSSVVDVRSFEFKIASDEGAIMNGGTANVKLFLEGYIA